MFDSKEMFDLGFAFLNAGEVSFHEGVIKQRSDYQNVAGVVNLAFACELFIKCLLNMAGMQTHGHDIEELWLKYKNAYGDTASEIESAVMNQLVTNLTFEEMLHNDSNVYYNYRYLYSSAPKSIATLRNPFPPGLRCRILPDGRMVSLRCMRLALPKSLLVIWQHFRHKRVLDAKEYTLRHQN